MVHYDTAHGGKPIGSFKVPKKGQASKSRKGEEDFTTKKSSKDFDNHSPTHKGRHLISI
jgi:hypothetical protein